MFYQSTADAGLAQPPAVVEALETESRGDLDFQALLMGLIARESAWNPGALRAEPHIGDASYGLCQVLLGTARLFEPAVTPSDLFIPAVNIRIGAAFLRDKVRQYGVEDGVSAYNAGRPVSGNRGYVADVLAYRDFYRHAIVPGTVAPEFFGDEQLWGDGVPQPASNGWGGAAGLGVGAAALVAVLLLARRG